MFSYMESIVSRRGIEEVRKTIQESVEADVYPAGKM